MNITEGSTSLKSTVATARRNIIDPSGEVYLTALIIRHDNPNKVRIFDAFDRLTSGQQGEKP